ncbi:MAG TPA: polysaccharide biosynthesis protein [Clostridia bacterium]|jgi:stage V sporulation protein B
MNSPKKSEQVVIKTAPSINKADFEAAEAVLPRTQAQTYSKSHTFVYGAMVLGVCSFLAKLMGAIFRIPLTHILGAEGVGLYQMVFPLYALLLTISSGGLPSALSKIIAEFTAKGQKDMARKALATALITLTAFGAVCALIILALHRVIAAAQGNEDAALSYIAIAPSIVLVAVISAFRGYFQGKQNMFPSALSQIIEQFVKMAAGLSLAFVLKGYGLTMGVFGAIMGVTLSELAAMLVIIWQYYKDKDRLKLIYPKGELKKYVKLIYAISIPMTISSIIMPITQLIDSVLVINILSKTFSAGVSTALYGLFSGAVSSLVNMPVVLLISISIALIPSIVASKAKGHIGSVEAKSSLALKLTILFSLPCFAGLLIYARPIIDFLYGGGLKVGEVNEPLIATRLLSIYSISVVFVSILSVTSSILQSLGYNFAPVKNLLIGAAIKIILNLILLNFIGIYGAPVSSLVCYAVAMTLNLISLKKRVKVKIEIINFILKPIIAAGFMGLCAYYSYKLFCYAFDYRLALLLGIALSAAVFLGLCLVMNILTEQEIADIPILKKLIKKEAVSK